MSEGSRLERVRPTLEAVARRAGVSRATVSRVVNGSPTVAEPIQRAVRQAVAELGYVPNLAARSLVTQRTDSIALVLPESASRVFSDDQFFPSIVHGVSQELEEVDKQLVLLMAGSAAGHDRLERYATARHVDGVLFASMHGADPLPGMLSRMGIPVVCSGRPLPPAPEHTDGGPTSHEACRNGTQSALSVPFVDVDHAGGVCRAIRHLLASGRNRIATIAGPQDMVAGVDRLAGYRAGLAGGGLAGGEPRPGATGSAPPVSAQGVVAFGDFTRESGAMAMRQLLAADPALDAVFVASDLMAHGALRTLREAGRRVPDDVAVIGFDDIELARYTDPPLTTVRQPILEIGRRMARQLLRLAAGEQIEPAVVLPTELIIRDSA